MPSVVAVLKTSPDTVLEDTARVMRLAGYQDALSKDCDTLIKLNLSWTKYFPACSTEPWQFHAVVKAMLEDGFAPARLLPVENRTVVTDPHKGVVNNAWGPVMRHYGLQFTALYEAEWVEYQFKEPLLKLQVVFPEGIFIPRMFIGKQVLHLPTVKTHGHSTTTGAIKNSFGGLLQEARHYAHKYMHEVLVDLMTMQRELHPGMFAVMDGTVCGNGAGPRTMLPEVKNYVLASADQVAIDAVAAKMMGFDPMSIPYIRMCTERGYGMGDVREVEIAGDSIEGVDFGFHTKRSFVIWGDQLIRKGPLSPLEKLLLYSPLWRWAPFASNVYHDWLWYPTIGRKRIREFLASEWGPLWRTYRDGSALEVPTAEPASK
jgi:uncharacterized protein (DUF362 family)